MRSHAEISIVQNEVADGAGEVLTSNLLQARTSVGADAVFDVGVVLVVSTDHEQISVDVHAVGRPFQSGSRGKLVDFLFGSQPPPLEPVRLKTVWAHRDRASRVVLSFERAVLGRVPADGADGSIDVWHSNGAAHEVEKRSVGVRRFWRRRLRVRRLRSSLMA